MKPLAIRRAAELPEREDGGAWLVEGLWAENEVGVIGGEPKSYKTFLALDLAVSVASGAPCLRRYPVPSPGRVLLYAAEDAFPDIRQRLAGICRAADVDFEGLDVQVIVEPSLRLDVADDRARLDQATARLRPVLVVLDPFVRLHRVDENVSSQVVPLLAFLRDLQRRHGCAVAVVHHARKGAARARPGQALRGSSEFHSWGGSNLYVRRTGENEVRLDVEHRAAPSQEGVCLRLATNGDSLALRVVDADGHAAPPTHRATPDERILDALADHGLPVAFAELRDLVGMRTQTFARVLAELVDRGAVTKDDGAYVLPA